MGTKPDFNEFKEEGRQFWEGLSLGGKVALGISLFGVYLAGWLGGGLVWALLSRIWS